MILTEEETSEVWLTDSDISSQIREDMKKQLVDSYVSFQREFSIIRDGLGDYLNLARCYLFYYNYLIASKNLKENPIEKKRISRKARRILNLAEKCSELYINDGSPWNSERSYYRLCRLVEESSSREKNSLKVLVA